MENNQLKTPLYCNFCKKDLMEGAICKNCSTDLLCLKIHQSEPPWKDLEIKINELNENIKLILELTMKTKIKKYPYIRTY